MRYAEFRRHLGKAGMTINHFAAYLGVRPASVSNYSKSGTVPRSYAIIAILLGETVDRGYNASELLESYGVFPQAVSTDSNTEQLDMFRSIQSTSTQVSRLSKQHGKGRKIVGGENSTKTLKSGGCP